MLLQCDTVSLFGGDMIIKIFDPVKGFPGVSYNLNKVDCGKADLVKMANFGALAGFSKLRTRDVLDYFLQLASLNTRTIYPMLHATISAEGRSSSKEELAKLAEKWLGLMGYAEQPYLIVFHKDTDNNHVHLVTSRIDKHGKKINSAFEHNRAIQALNKAIGLDENLGARKDLQDALNYRFSTRAQFMMILEARGYMIRDNHLIKYGRKLLEIPPDAIKFRATERKRVIQLGAIFDKYRQRYDARLEPLTVTLPSGHEKLLHKYRSDLSDFLRVKFGVELVFHSSDNKPPYGYTVIDHSQKQVFKGGEIMMLKELLEPVVQPAAQYNDNCSTTDSVVQEPGGSYDPPIRISIADDVDDQQIHGMRRRRQKKARTNTR